MIAAVNAPPSAESPASHDEAGLKFLPDAVNSPPRRAPSVSRPSSCYSPEIHRQVFP